MSDQEEFLKVNSWITNDFFEKILQQKYDTNFIVLKSFTCDVATEKEEYCGSLTNRVKLYYSFSANENMDIVCSTIVIKTDVLNKQVQENFAFSKEVIFYRDILPALYQILDEKITGAVFAPRYNQLIKLK